MTEPAFEGGHATTAAGGPPPVVEDDGGFLTPRFIAVACRGRWQRPPSGPSGLDRPLAGVAIDSREAMPQRAFIAIRGERHDGHDHLEQAVRQGAAVLVVDRPLPPALRDRLEAAILEVEDGRRALRSLASAWRSSLRDTRVIGVTGSCGKTTTRRLIDAALRTRLRGVASPKSFNNEIGVPLTILSANRDAEYLLLEIGTSGPGEIGQLGAIASPHFGVVTMVGRAHLEGLGSLEAVAAEKCSLLDRLVGPAVAVTLADGGILAAAVEGRRRRLGESITFGTHPAAAVRVVSRQADPQGQWVELAGSAAARFEGIRRLRMRLPGAHNAANAAAAIAVALRMGVPFDDAAAAIAEVGPEDRRVQIEAMPGGGMLINDAYNANPESMSAALETLVEFAGGGRPCRLVLGDMLELGPASEQLHEALAREVASLRGRIEILEVVWVGSGSRLAAATTAAAGVPTRHQEAATPELAASIRERLPPEGVVLLKASRGVGLDRLAEWMRA